MRKVTPGPPRHLQTHQETLRISPQQRLQQVFCPQHHHQETLLYDFIMYSPSAARTDTASFVWVSNTRIPVHVCFIPDTTGPWYITNWFNLSRNLNNAIVPFVRVNVPTGPAWSISVRWIVAFISVAAALRIPCMGVKEGSRADVWRNSFDAPFHSECRRVYTFFFLLLGWQHLSLIKVVTGRFRSRTRHTLRAVHSRQRSSNDGDWKQIKCSSFQSDFDGWLKKEEDSRSKSYWNSQTKIAGCESERSWD